MRGPGSDQDRARHTLAQNSSEITRSRATGQGAAFLRIKPVVRGVRGFAASLSLISRPAKRRTGGATRMLSRGMVVRAARNHGKQEGHQGRHYVEELTRVSRARSHTPSSAADRSGPVAFSTSNEYISPLGVRRPAGDRDRLRPPPNAAATAPDEPVTKWVQGAQKATGRGRRGGARVGSDLRESLAACGGAWPAPPRTPKSRAGPCTSSRLPCTPSSTPLCPRAGAT